MPCVCIGCGCDDFNACVSESGACHWSEIFPSNNKRGICSRCAKIAARLALHRARTPPQLSVGMKVRVKADARGPTGKFRKCAGRAGTLEQLRPLVVRFGPRAHEIVANLSTKELEPA